MISRESGLNQGVVEEQDKTKKQYNILEAGYLKNEMLINQQRISCKKAMLINYLEWTSGIREC